MKINIICPQCSSDGIARFFLESIRDDGLYQGKCPAGHDVIVGTQTLRYEMLFEIAVNAIKDGYYREAITSFAASIERFYEFSIRVLSKDAKVPDEILNTAWKLVTSQSERQLGAYVFIYTLRYSKAPKLLSQRLINLRNNVVHKGFLPNKDEAIEFGREAYELIQEGVKILRESNLAEVNAVLQEHVSSVAQGMEDQYPRSFMVTTTILNVIEDLKSGYKSFDKLLLEQSK